MDTGMSANTCHVRLLGKEHAWLLPFDAHTLLIRLSKMLSCATTLKRDACLYTVELLLVRDGEMSKYNAEAMGCTGPTNILSFPSAQDGDFALQNALLEAVSSLVLSVDAVRREAFLFHQPPQTHLLRLLAHGIGHLSGFDHGQRMDSFCNNILNLK